MKFVASLAVLSVATASVAASANDLSKLKAGRYEPVGIACESQSSGDFVSINKKGREFSEWGVDCDVLGRSKSGGYKISCVDWDTREKHQVDISIQVLSKTAMKIQDTVYNWCAVK